MGAVAHGECQICGSTKLVEAWKRIAELEDALRPFADFNVQGAWIGTAWEHRPRTDPVLYCHATTLAVTLEDFDAARAAMIKTA